MQFDRTIVRLGEHDTTTTEDGPHKDMLVMKIDKHAGYDDEAKINDIAIIHLWGDVQFTGAIYSCGLKLLQNLTWPSITMSFFLLRL